MSEPNPLFDSAWYFERYPDAAGTGLDPYEHYRTVGAAQGYDPHPLFDTSYYLLQYHDIIATGVNPLEHFLSFGAVERRHPHLLFDTSWYLEQYPDVAATGINPLLHYLVTGAREGRDPNPYFKTSVYLEGNPEVSAAGVNPLIHFVTTGAMEAQNSARRQIQVHRRQALGDVLLITPVLKALRQKYPADEIVVTTDHPEIIRGNPYVDRVLKSRLPLSGFDQTFDLEYELRPEDHIVDAYARIAQVSIEDRTPEIYLTHNERVAANDLLQAAGVRPYERFCVMQLTSGWAVRDWPVACFKRVADALEKDGIRIVVLGDWPEPPIDFGVDLRGKTTVRHAAAIIEKCALVVSIDSALMHFGYAFRRPVVSLFGCTDPEKRVPDWGLALALYSDVVCRGCHHRQRPVPAKFAPDCPWETVRCMEQLSTNPVIALARAELQRAERPEASIIIPHYFKWDMLNPCLESIFRWGARYPFEVVVVANGSPEENLQQLQAWRPSIRIVTLQPNQGFSKACNAGAKAARGKYLVFLNDDTTVTPGWLDEMVGSVESDPRNGITGPKLLYPVTNGIQHCGTVFNENGQGEHIYRHLPGNFVGANRPRYYRALTGACLLIERGFFMRLGGFETSYHGTGGCEDTDLCFKVLEHGRMVAYCPTSVVYHHEGVTRGLRDEHHPEDVYNRRILRQHWSKYLGPDVSDYCLLGEIEAGEGKTWRWLRDVPMELVARYDSPERRAVGRPPFRVQVGSGSRPEVGYLHLDGSGLPQRVDITHNAGAPLPFVAGSVGEILASDVLERLSAHDLPGVLREFHRVLSPGGKLSIRTSGLRGIAEEYRYTVNGPNSAGTGTGDRSCVDAATRANGSFYASEGEIHDLRYFWVDGAGLATLCKAVGFSEICLAPASARLDGEIEVIAFR
jgi:GT2 family glycosyltransferase/ADP-heptose:LPS heptosyltransferase